MWLYRGVFAERAPARTLYYDYYDYILQRYHAQQAECVYPFHIHHPTNVKDSARDDEPALVVQVLYTMLNYQCSGMWLC